MTQGQRIVIEAVRTEAGQDFALNLAAGRARGPDAVTARAEGVSIHEPPPSTLAIEALSGPTGGPKPRAQRTRAGRLVAGLR